MTSKIKKIVFAFSLLFIVFLECFILRASSVENELDRVKTLSTLKIIDNEENLDLFVTRAEFSKMLVKATSDKDKTIGNVVSAITNDVDGTNPYAGYIKIALEKSYMFTYLGGLFKPNDYVTYSDLCFLF